MHFSTSRQQYWSHTYKPSRETTINTSLEIQQIVNEFSKVYTSTRKNIEINYQAFTNAILPEEKAHHHIKTAFSSKSSLTY